MPTIFEKASVFKEFAIATPHPIASRVGADVLASGGNAVDAAVAANLSLGVLMPYSCGVGGDLFCLLTHRGKPTALESAGRSPEAADLEAVLRALGRAAASGPFTDQSGSSLMPLFGPLSVTVPGAVAGWSFLLASYGTRTFADLAAPAILMARNGFHLRTLDAARIRLGESRYGDWANVWHHIYGGLAEGASLIQPELADTLSIVASEGPDAFYRGAIAEDIVREIRRLGGFLSLRDLSSHRVAAVQPLQGGFGDLEILELPPPTQGVTALEALAIAEGFLPCPTGDQREHLLIECAKSALADRRFVTDPIHMNMSVTELLDPIHIAMRRDSINLEKASSPKPARPALGGTVFICAVDGDGDFVSLIQSNFMGFGSGVTVPGRGINLQNRAGWFSLNPQDADVIAPSKQPLHTLIPAMALQSGYPLAAFGTEGGDGQAQIHLQLLTHLAYDGMDAQQAINRPRWRVDPVDWAVDVEPATSQSIVDGLRKRGHVVRRSVDVSFGWAQAIVRVDDHLEGATDPRAGGVVAGR